MRRRLPPPRAARPLVAAVLLVALTACGPGPDVGDEPAGVEVPADPGAASRQAALARLGGRGAPRTSITPDVVGRTAAHAQDLLTELGLDVHVVAFDPQQPVAVQWPAADQPVPLDGVIEVWLGHPPADADPDPQGVPAPTELADAADDAGAVATPTPSPSATASPTAPAATTHDVAVGYVLPPHTAGLLRTNPRHLPALPLGTELSGTASWYGPGFHGLQTACGGTYDQNGATIAARELRCGTLVRITGPTGLTVEATVTDWGPAEWTGRRFDLSAAVFNAIAPLGAGVVPVRVVTANVPG